MNNGLIFLQFHVSVAYIIYKWIGIKTRDTDRGSRLQADFSLQESKTKSVSRKILKPKFINFVYY